MDRTYNCICIFKPFTKRGAEKNRLTFQIQMGVQTEGVHATRQMRQKTFFENVEEM